MIWSAPYAKEIRLFLANLGDAESAARALKACQPKTWLLPGLGKRVYEARKARGWSQETLARKAGIAICTVGKIEAGNPASRRSLVGLARALSVSVEFLAGNGTPLS